MRLFIGLKSFPLLPPLFNCLIRVFLSKLCDASDYVVAVVLGQRIDNKPYVTYYASKVVDEAQQNYTTIEKEILMVVYAIKKLQPYLLWSKVRIYTNHSTLKHFLGKVDWKPQLIRCVLLLQEFALEIRDKKGTENVVMDHLS